MPAASPSCVLAIDIGTSSVRTALFDAKARRVPGSMRQLKYSVSHSPAGAAQLDPAALRKNLWACLEGTLVRGKRRKVSAVGISCFWHSLVGADAKGRLLTPIYTWEDARCREDAARFRQEMPEAEYHALTGCMLRASYWPAKLRWLARTRPSLWKKVARWHSPAEFLLDQLCENGGAVCAHGMATGTGLYNPNALAWDSDLLKRCGVRPDQLPEISDEPLRLRDHLHRRFPELSEARWWPAIGDGAAGNLGSGATHAGRAAINVGTSAAFRVMRRGKIGKVPLGLFCYRVDRERSVVGGAVSNAGNLRAWCRRELNLPQNEAALERALSARPRPSEGLTVLPFWSAERAPTWCETLAGTVTGFSQDTTALDLLQATTEAVYHRLALIADLSSPPTRRQGAAPTEIVVSGGILQSAGLLQRLANVLGRPVHPSREPEASLRGAAVYALERSGFHPDASASIGPVVRPQTQLADIYAQERRRQQRLEKLLTRFVEN